MYIENYESIWGGVDLIKKRKSEWKNTKNPRHCEVIYQPAHRKQQEGHIIPVDSLVERLESSTMVEKHMEFNPFELAGDLKKICLSTQQYVCFESEKEKEARQRFRLSCCAQVIVG